MIYAKHLWKLDLHGIGYTIGCLVERLGKQLSNGLHLPLPNAE